MEGSLKPKHLKKCIIGKLNQNFQRGVESSKKKIPSMVDVNGYFLELHIIKRQCQKTSYILLLTFHNSWSPHTHLSILVWPKSFTSLNINHLEMTDLIISLSRGRAALGKILKALMAPDEYRVEQSFL